MTDNVHVDEVVQHDSSTWNVHYSPRKEGARILRAVDLIEKLQKELIEPRRELRPAGNSTRAATLTRMIQAREKKITETFQDLHLSTAQVEQLSNKLRLVHSKVKDLVARMGDEEARLRPAVTAAVRAAGVAPTATASEAARPSSARSRWRRSGASRPTASGSTRSSGRSGSPPRTWTRSPTPSRRASARWRRRSAR